MVLNSQSFTTKGTAIGPSYVINHTLGLVGNIHVLVVGRKGQPRGLATVKAAFILSNGIELTRRIFGMNASLIADIYPNDLKGGKEKEV